MPLFSDLPAGSAHEGHRHGTAHGTDLLGVCRLAVGTWHMRMTFFVHFSDCRVESDRFLKLFFLFLAFTFETTGICLFTKIIDISVKICLVGCLISFIVWVFFPVNFNIIFKILRVVLFDEIHHISKYYRFIKVSVCF